MQMQPYFNKLEIAWKAVRFLVELYKAITFMAKSQDFGWPANFKEVLSI